MKPDIENLKVWMSGRSTTGYQRALGMREFEKLLSYVAELEQLRQPLVISSVCKCKGGAVGRTVTADFEHQICDRCGNIAN